MRDATGGVPPNTTFTHPFNINSCQFRSAGAIKPAIVVSDFNSRCIKVLDMSGQLPSYELLLSKLHNLKEHKTG